MDFIFNNKTTIPRKTNILRYFQHITKFKKILRHKGVRTTQYMFRVRGKIWPIISNILKLVFQST